MADPAEIERIRIYLEQQRDTYDRDALRNNLLADGHDPEAIEQAMAQVYAEQQVLPASQVLVAQSRAVNWTAEMPCITRELTRRVPGCPIVGRRRSECRAAER